VSVEKMSRVQFPSQEFPDFPAVSLQPAEGWTTRPVPGTVLAVVLDRGPEKFSPNVVVTLTRGVDTTWEDADAAVDAFVSGLSEVESAPRERPVFDERPWSVLEFAHVTEEAGTVFQLIAVALLEHGPVVDSVRVTASIAPEDMDEVLPVLRRIVASTQISVR
jgi:hypothetical protein